MHSKGAHGITVEKPARKHGTYYLYWPEFRKGNIISSSQRNFQYFMSNIEHTLIEKFLGRRFLAIH